MNNHIKKALVTGASSGIGKAICSMLIKNGYEVYGIGRKFEDEANDPVSISVDKAKDVGVIHAVGTNTPKFHRVVCDLSDRDALTACIKNINSDHDICLFVSNAGVGYYGLHEELNPSVLHEMTSVNLEAPMIITNLLLRDIKKNSGTICFISSVTAEEINPHGCAYGATKAALTSFAHSLFAESRKYGVRIINIEPDMTRTGLYRNADFECADEDGTYLEPDDVVTALETALSTRSGVLVSDIKIIPQFHRIKRKTAKGD